MNLKFQISNLKCNEGFAIEVLKKIWLEVEVVRRIVNKNLQSGFTIVETILYLGLLSMLLAVLSGTFGMIMDTQLEYEATSSVEQDSRYLFSKLSYDINNADSIVVPAALGDENPTLQLTNDGTTYTYGLDGNGNLIVSSGISDDQLNGFDTTLSNLNFKRLGNPDGKNSIQLSFTINSRTIKTSGQETKTINTTIGTR
jgi:type II secretory pathway pseudopilin PulG